MTTTPHLQIALVQQAQAQKEVTVNEAFARIDAVLNAHVQDHTLNAPPASPAQGDVYVVGDSPTGAWANHCGEVAYFDELWRFIVPAAGLRLYAPALADWLLFDGSAWQAEHAVPQAYSAQQYAAMASLSDAASIAWDLNSAQTAKVTLGGSRTLADPTNMQAGGTYVLLVQQDASGGRNLSFGDAYKFAGGATPSFTGDAGAVDILTFVSDGSAMYGVAQQNFS